MNSDSRVSSISLNIKVDATNKRHSDPEYKPFKLFLEPATPALPRKLNQHGFKSQYESDLKSKTCSRQSYETDFTVIKPFIPEDASDMEVRINDMLDFECIDQCKVESNSFNFGARPIIDLHLG